MPFQEKSAITLAGILAVVYGGYFAFMGWRLATTPVDDIPWQPLLALTVVPLTVLAAVSHIGLALFAPADANAYDERDREITRRAEQPGGIVLAITVFAGIVLAMVEAHGFFIANALMLGWVLAQLTDEVMTIVLYRRGT